MKHFLTTTDYTRGELQSMIDVGLRCKDEAVPRLYENAIMALIFANPSLRTRLSFESGMKKLGGSTNTLDVKNAFNFEYKNNTIMDGKNQEHIKEAARVISRYCDIIGVRKSELITTSQDTQSKASWNELRTDRDIQNFTKYATKPVINMESNMYHPCQSTADMMTMQEQLGSIAGKKYVLTWTPHPKALPLATPHSQLLTPCIFGMNVTLAYPEGFDLDSDVIQTAKELNPNLNITNNQEEAFKDADVIMAKSWSSLQYFGEWEKEKEYRQKFSSWKVDSHTMNLTNNAYFMHCLPVRRNVVVTDEVVDSPQSIIIDQAENRMWAQMGIIDFLLQ